MPVVYQRSPSLAAQDTIAKPNVNDLTEIATTFQNIANVVGTVCQIPSVLLMRQNNDTMEVISSSQHPLNPYRIGDSGSLGQGHYCETVISTQRELLVPNALLDPKWDESPGIELGMIAYYGVPVNWPDGRFFGTFCVHDNKEHAFSQQYKQVITQFRHVIEMLLHQVIDQQQLSLSMNTDALTGIASRKHLMERLCVEFARTKRYCTPLSVIYMDLDHFKSINDFYGHQWGDRVLERFATEVTQELRETDFFGRIGGEEFILGLPNTDCVGAMVMAERICNRINSINIVAESGEIKVTVSCGLTKVSDSDAKIEDTLHRADQYMYQAKQQGRNRIIGDT